MSNDFIGTGWSFPPKFNMYSGEVEMVSGIDEIEGSLAVLFSTQLGERLFRSDYGSSLDDYQFYANNNVTLIRVKRMITSAVNEFEPRIDLKNVEVDMSNMMEGKLVIRIDYVIKNSNTSANMVYPFYFEKQF